MGKRLVVCCDGTWNRPDQVQDGALAPTNVTKLALGVLRRGDDGVEQVLHYHKGVGTGRWERLRGGAFGFGLSRNVRDCYRFICESFEPGDEIFLFGFSRGAFTARSVAGLVRNSGILRPEHRDRADDAYRLYRSRSERHHPRAVEARLFRRMYSHDEEALRIALIGVWDTVGALGIPVEGLHLVTLLNQRWGFHDVELSSRVGAAFQALAIDERRRAFRPTVWRQQVHAEGQRLEQVWFSGVHCDVGGGYADPALSEIALLWMVERAREHGLALDPARFKRGTAAPAAEARQLGEVVAPDPLGKAHESRRGLYRLLPGRWRRVPHPEASEQWVASSARRRLERCEDYRPPGLREHLAAGGRVVEVPGS